MNIPRILHYYGEDLLHVDKDGTITISVGVTKEKLAQALLESIETIERMEKMQQQNYRMLRLLGRTE